ncbi:histidine kinase [Flavilitoribacter nigricans]|uniref:Signal transduction histidine kinase internal region domain-containing protein n=1 Tax=Flavilitoribacter nigricans (strain ATCC 23147 / DSM 23189 / NBRC 102662 / NCIMB 1420 / SS-2) TaxID=1122177 RepID=A0A2D0N1B3_FLAN2|nr:histidine kinase [Flavilitoribacter nigricans]PHN02168.1 hypothetical protein CRP01_33810 [Flavilitoribacter nigricans DSM 23189 = NBRC 102662]
MKNIAILPVLLCLTKLLSAQTSPVYRISFEFAEVNAEQEPYNDLYDYTEILLDPTGAWGYEEVLQRSDQFGPNTTRTDRDLAQIYWMKLQLRATARDSHLFSVGRLYEENNLVDIYYQQGDSLYHQTAGFRRRPAEKTIRRSGSYFWVDLPADTIQTVYIRVDNQYGDCDHCYFEFEKRPLSVFYIDHSTVRSLEAAYILQDLETMEEPNRFEPPRMVDVSWYFEFYVDTDCNLDLESVRRSWDSGSYFKGFQRVEFDYTSCHWARLRVINPKRYAQSRTFAYPSDPWKSIEYHLPDTVGRYHKMEAFPSAEGREAFSFSIPAGDTLELYIRYPRRTSSYTYADDGDMADIHPGDLQKRQYRDKYKTFFIGGLAFFLIYIFLQLIVYRDSLQLYFFLLLVGLSPYLMMALDHSQFLNFTEAIFRFSTLERDWILGLAAPLAVFALLKFTQHLLNLKNTLPLFFRIANYLISLYIIISIIDLLDILWWSTHGLPTTDLCITCYANSIKGMLQGCSAILVLCAGIKSYYRKIPLSASFVLSFLPLIMAMVIASPLGQLLFPHLERAAPFIAGHFLTLMLFGILIGIRNNRIQMEKLESVKQKAQLQNDLLQIESKALRAQMNPHFIFNCLNSIKGLIQEAANRQAIHYLTLFSRFIRRVLQHSEEKQISLEEELEMSRLYIEMEKLRFERSFTYRIKIAPEVDPSFFRVPPMILQPFLENAIWHGLMHKAGDREIRLEIRPEGAGVKCIVEDNGIGREQAAALNLSRQHQHRSFGTRLIMDRLQVNKALFNSNFVVNIIDQMQNGRAAGTRVELILGA